VKRVKPGTVVWVVMDDIEHHDLGWQTLRWFRQRRHERYEAIGIVVQDTRRSLILASVVNRRDGKAFCAYRIPRGSIRSLRVLE
jgi:hypothetical protein